MKFTPGTPTHLIRAAGDKMRHPIDGQSYEELKAEIARLNELLEVAGGQYLNKNAECLRLRAALKPFADQITAIECTTDHEYRDEDEWPDCAFVKIGDLRRARDAYQQAEKESSK